ncbi:zinc finger protein OZF [Sitodiplosis mosellana]|uniref:zinc finger protein OZF n=1 Tax=Sitodiplosis mosellana TaxID=263140 RepID=UPI0024448052|nr:zinc finger protein OZF [Sitodiplosis mosellana]
MNPYPSKGTCGGKGKRRRKRRSLNTTIEVKQENVVKEEPRDNVGMVDVTRPPRQPPSTEAIDVIKSEADTDSEMYFEYADDCVKREIKSEDECTKKGCDSAQGANSNGGDDQHDEPIDGNPTNPRTSSNDNDEQRKRKAKTQKKPSDRKKTTNARASNKAAVKRQKKHMCHLCSYAASQKWLLTRHVRVHTGERPFECKICAKSFSLKRNLCRHEKFHGPRLAFRCLKCCREFAQETDKNDHESNCKCPRLECYACKYTTFQLSFMKQHMRTHSGQKLFACSVCVQTFMQKNHLRQHSRTHIKQLPFACSNCGQRFNNDNEKQSHEKRCTCRRYECYLCFHKCFTKNRLKQHMRSKHTSDMPFECAVCGLKFSYHSDLKRHLTTHAKPRPFRCLKCWKSFKEEGKKNAHEGQCNSRLHQCYLCKANTLDSASLKKHFRALHTGERPFECKFCEVRFVDKYSAARHMKHRHNLENLIQLSRTKHKPNSI